MELRSLLLSQDEPTVEIMRWALEDLGLSVELLSNVGEARKRAETQKFDAILVDCDVPGGIEFLDGSLEPTTNASTVTFAVVDSDLGIPVALQRGANLAMQKPVTLDSARSVLRSAYSMIMQERRSHTRYPVDVPVKILSPEGNKTMHGMLLNASQGGISLECEPELSINSRVKLSFHLPGMKDAMDVAGMVLWVRNGKAGLQFESLSATMRQRLEDWLLTQAASLTSS